jgi:hypothetical protein
MNSRTVRMRLENFRCIHHGPSVVDHRTPQRSGRLPLEFLCGCGLPNRPIDYLPSLLEDAIQYYSWWSLHRASTEPKLGNRRRAARSFAGSVGIRH